MLLFLDQCLHIRLHMVHCWWFNYYFAEVKAVVFSFSFPFLHSCYSSFTVDPCWIFNFQLYSILNWLYVLVHSNIRVCCKLAIDLNGCSISKFLKCLKCLVESWMVTQRDIFIFWLKAGTKLYVLIILESLRPRG